MCSKDVKLILIGGKNDKIFTTVIVWGLYAWITNSYLVNDFPHQNFLDKFCKLKQKACNNERTMT